MDSNGTPDDPVAEHRARVREVKNEVARPQARVLGIFFTALGALTFLEGPQILSAVMFVMGVISFFYPRKPRSYIDRAKDEMHHDLEQR